MGLGDSVALACHRARARYYTPASCGNSSICQQVVAPRFARRRAYDSSSIFRPGFGMETWYRQLLKERGAVRAKAESEIGAFLIAGRGGRSLPPCSKLATALRTGGGYVEYGSPA